MKAVFIDLDKTIIHYDDPSLDDNMMLEWLRREGVSNPEGIYFTNEWPDIKKRLDYLNVDLSEYRNKWRPRFPDVEIKYKKRMVHENEVRLNEGALEFLEDLVIPVALISNSAPKVVDYMLEHFELSGYFNYLFRRKYDFDDITKPHASVGNNARISLGLTNSDKICMIGDSNSDMQFAKNCGFIGINMFFKQNEFDFFFDSFSEMHNYFRENYSKCLRGIKHV